MFTDCRAASKLAKEVDAEGGALTLGGVSQCPSYLTGKSKEEVQAEFRKQIKVFVEEDLDFLLCEVIISLSLCVRISSCHSFTCCTTLVRFLSST